MFRKLGEPASSFFAPLPDMGYKTAYRMVLTVKTASVLLAITHI